MKIRAPAGSPPTGSRQMSTFATSIASSAQPVTGIAPATPVVLLTGVSKLPKGLPADGLEMFTWICFGDPMAPGAVTVTMPFGPALADTWNEPLPVPAPFDTTMLDRLEVAVQAKGAPLVKLTITV